MNTFKLVDKPNRAILGRLQYGTVVTDAPSNPESIYVKVNKISLGAGLRLEWPRKTSVLLNVKTGALRAVSEDALVTVLEVDATLHPLDYAGCKAYYKAYYKTQYCDPE